MTLDILCIPALADNYIWLVHHNPSGETVVVDPAEADPVLRAAQAKGWRIGQIWNTHWHPDHVGGNAAIKAATGARVIGPAREAERIPGIDQRVDEGDHVALGSARFAVWAVPGHTLGHIAYIGTQDAAGADLALAFVGDTLFAMGCGRLFEGTAEQMFANMERLRGLPDPTQIYCAHEYTQANGRFAVTVDPGNPDLLDRMATVDAMRARGEATVPTTLALEKATNPFLCAPDAARFAALRQAKDRF